MTKATIYTKDNLIDDTHGMSTLSSRFPIKYASDQRQIAMCATKIAASNEDCRNKENCIQLSLRHFTEIFTILHRKKITFAQAE